MSIDGVQKQRQIDIVKVFQLFRHLIRGGSSAAHILHLPGLKVGVCSGTKIDGGKPQVGNEVDLSKIV